MNCLLLTLPYHTLHHFPLLPLPPTHHLSLKCSSKWDSNAESFRTQKHFNFDLKNNKKSTNKDYFDDGDKDDDYDEGNDIEQGVEVLEEYIDSIWILKVFGSYGWFLPFILVSMLLASGPKAFLMALALPLGQSIFSFAFQKMWGSEENRSKRKMKTKKRSRARRSRTVRGKNTMKEKMGYQSWVPRREVAADRPNNKGVSSFGGWDELDRDQDFSRGPSVKSDPRMGISRKRPPDEDKFSRIERKSETPLLLRLLISVFPFLSSWTKML